ncbi:MAG: MOP flippase family protein [Acidobacteriota bacterium]
MAEEKSPSISSQTATNSFWSGIGSVSQQLVTFLATLILARLLPKDVYGLIAEATIVTGFLVNLKDMGTGAAVVRHPELDRDLLSSIFWFNVLVGSLAALLVFALAEPVALFFHEPALFPIVGTLGLSLLFSSIAIVHSSLLTREMTFRRITLVENAATLLGYAVGITLAWRGAGVWSIVAANLTNAASAMVFFYLAHGWKPRLHFRFADLKPVAHYGLNLSGFIVVNYVSRNGDNAIIGRRLGEIPLANYNMAYQLMLYPMQGIGGTLGRVLFPALSKLQADPVRMQAGYLRACGGLAVIMFPAMLGLMVTCEPFVWCLLGGEKWLAIVPILTVLAPVGFLQSVVSPAGNIYMAVGRTDLLFRLSLVSTTVLLISFFIGVHWGALGVAVAYAIFNVVSFYPQCALAFRLIGLPFSRFMMVLAPVAAISGAMAGAAFLWRMQLQSWGIGNSWLMLVSTSLVGAVVYIGLMLFFRPAALRGFASAFAESPSPAFARLGRWIG